MLSGSPKSWLEEKLKHSDTEAIHSFPWKNQEESHSVCFLEIYIWSAGVNLSTF